MPSWLTRGPRASTLDTQVDTQLGASTFGDWIDALKPGDLVGRYVVRGLLGAGGMGVVLEAFDPMLDRKIALKVLRCGPAQPEPGESSNNSQGVGGQLLMREANGMAQLSHPNVMPIFDVGWIEGRFFLAMELNVGLTLSGWLSQKVRSWRDIVNLMVQAADGLAAIHAVGLIHCDFKPGNVLIDIADHLKIADFGLAKRIDAPQHRGTSSTSRRERSRQDTTSGSRSHGHAGTLSYMAPEQHRGDLLDPRCDQFAFFVTLYEALLGRLPFRGGGHDELLERIAMAPRKEGFYRGKQRIPTWLVEALQQGLAFEPDARFSDMKGVSVALQQGLQASKKRPLYWTIFTGGAMASALAAANLATSTDPCDSVALRATTVWNQAIEHDLAQHFLGSALANAAIEWEKVRAQLDDQIGHWTEVAVQQCRINESFDAQGQRCLDASLVAIGSAARVLLAGNDQTLSDPANVLAVIPDPQACFTASGSQLTTSTPWPQDSRSQEAVAKLRDQILHLRMLGRAGDLTGLYALYRELVPQARQINYWPVWAELEFQTALGLAQFLELGAARPHFHRAHLLAKASGHDDILGWTLASEVYGFAYLPDENDGFTEKKALARAVVQRLHDPPLLMAEWLNNVGIVELNTGQFDRALARFRGAQTLAGNLRGHSYLSSAERLNNIAISLQAMGLAEQSRTLLLQGLKGLLNADGTRRTRAGIWSTLGAARFNWGATAKPKIG